MLLIHCPYCNEALPEAEFAYAGEAHIARPADPSAETDEAWRDFLFIRSNVRGVHAERWRHVHGCGRFFNALRDTVSDKFAGTYEAGTPRPALPDAERGE
jgi:sarcosine oxidase subunit delta